MYADRITDSMRQTIDETERRRKIQEQHTTKRTISRLPASSVLWRRSMRPAMPEEAKRAKLDLKEDPQEDEYGSLIKDLTSQMDLAAANLQFETAAELRDLIDDIKAKI